MAQTPPRAEVHKNLEGDSVPSRDSLLHPHKDQLQGWTNAPNNKCYSSFGDRGTTGTVSAFGNIIQFSTTMKEVVSGIVIAEHTRMTEPYDIHKRTSEILELAEERSSGESAYGFSLNGLIADTSPRLTYVNYRWPRFEYPKNQDGFSTTVQWAIFEDTVLQQCTVKNDGAEDNQVKFRFTEGMGIRDVDYLDPYNHFNDSDERSIDIVKSDTSRWIRFHQLHGNDVSKFQ